jgi:hypothetical protein
MGKETLLGPKLHRAVSARVDSVDDTTRTFQLSWASDDISVMRASYFDDPWLETLSLDPADVDLTRLNSGNAPLLWGHDDYSRDNNIGVIQKAWVEKGRGLAVVRMSMRPDLDGLWLDVKSEIISNVSVGYQILERTLQKQNEDGPNEYLVTSWLPMEISLVSVPADETVGIGRSTENNPQKFVVTPNKEERTMSDVTVTPAAPVEEVRSAPAAVVVPEGGEATPPIRPIPVSDDLPDPIRGERSRIASITTLARKADMGDEFLTNAIQKGLTVEQVRAAVLDKLVENQPTHRPMVTPGKDQIDKTRAAAENWLMARSGTKVDGKSVKVEGDNDFRGMTLIEMAAHRLNSAGVSTRGLDKMEIAKRAITHSTSDFPIVLGNVFNKILLAAYAAIPDTWRAFSKVGSVSDFRATNRYRMGNFGALDLIPEGGEYKYGSLGDAEMNPASVATKGKMFSVTRQLLINDDLGALTDILQLMGRGAKRGIEIDVYAALALNSGNGPVMQDGNQLFSSAHANLAGAGAAPSITTIPAASQAMQSQVYGNDFIDVTPTIFLAGVATAATMKILNASQYDPTVNKFQAPNPAYQAFTQVIGTPRISGNAWYVFADPDIEPVLEVDFLNGAQEPYTEQRDGWNVDGIEYKVRFDYGVNAVGFRGAYRNPGA